MATRGSKTKRKVTCKLCGKTTKFKAGNAALYCNDFCRKTYRRIYSAVWHRHRRKGFVETGAFREEVWAEVQKWRENEGKGRNG